MIQKHMKGYKENTIAIRLLMETKIEQTHIYFTKIA